MKSLSVIKVKEFFNHHMERRKLIKGWDSYSEADIYKVNVVKQHKQRLVDCFIPLENKEKSRVLEIGPGRGVLFEDIAKIISPKHIYTIDWSPGMVKRAGEEAEKVEKKYDVKFHFLLGNLEESLPWPDNFFDAAVSLLVICYIPGGWKRIVKELARVVKPGGQIYLAPLVDEDFIRKAIWHLAAEFFKQPMVCLNSLKYRREINRIAEEAKKQGSEFPDPEELIKYLESLAFEDVKSFPTYWGGGGVFTGRLKS